jgi:hypothetical protein
MREHPDRVTHHWLVRREATGVPEDPDGAAARAIEREVVELPAGIAPWWTASAEFPSGSCRKAP